MKKNYLKPESMVINILLTKLVCNSPGAPAAGISSDEEIGAGFIESRGTGLWGDDED